MNDGFLRVAAATPALKVADSYFNTNKIIELIDKAYSEKVKVLVFPELCITGYTASDLFFQKKLLDEALEGLKRIIAATNGKRMLTFVGLPFMHKSKLYNVAAAVNNGNLLGFVCKKNIPDYGEFYESRWFTASPEKNEKTSFNGKEFLLGNKLIFRCEELKDVQVGVEICEDLWVLSPPSEALASNGATIICNLSASDEIIGKDAYRLDLVKATSARLISAYVYASAGEGESTTDMVFTGCNIICENGAVLNKSEYTYNALVKAEVDVEKLLLERAKTTTFRVKEEDFDIIPFSLEVEKLNLERVYSKYPFVPESKELRDERCSKIIKLQALGLKKRLEHTNAKCAVIGLSGGLDSTLSLLVTNLAFELLNKNKIDIIAVTMPCFGTTKRTKNNAELLAEALGTSFVEIDIRNSVLSHFKDIRQDESNHDVTYENGQARERTQVLMDIANRNNGIVVGTGDLSELALGWATYNGDHMSMYGVNSGVPKTLVRFLVSYFAETTENEVEKKALSDILLTPVSPELLPPKDGKISQVTEDIVGPYELHDFFLYYFVRQSFSPKKIYRLCKIAFNDIYDDKTIKKWLKTFIKRFFSQQFKRSCLPDGPKIGTITLSPRSDWRMPSDASVNVWLKEADEL